MTYTQQDLSVIVDENEVIELFQEDFDQMLETGNTIKGIYFQEAAGFNISSGNYKLGEDIFLNYVEGIWLADNDNVVLDLNNKSINSNGWTIEVTAGKLTINGNGTVIGPVLPISNVGNLTINGNVEVVGNEADYSSVSPLLNKISIMSTGSLTINNGSYNGTIIAADNSSTIINNGNFNDNSVALVVSQFDGSNANILKISGGTFNGGLMGVYIDGVNDLSISRGNFEGSLAGVTVGQNAFVEASISGGKFKASDNGYGGFTVLGNYPEETFKSVINSVLSNGYKFDNVLEYYQSNDNTFGTVSYSQKEISVIPIEGEYEIIEGENQTYKDSDIVIKADGDIELFEKLLVDGEEVDEENYTVERGSTIVTLKKEYIDSLSEGEHTVTFVYANGIVSTTFNKTISNVPETLDNIYSYIIMLIVSLTLMVINKKQLNF